MDKAERACIIKRHTGLEKDMKSEVNFGRSPSQHGCDSNGAGSGDVLPMDVESTRHDPCWADM
jgi:hypothetical protein